MKFKTKTILIYVFFILLLCGCNQKTSLESDIKEYETKLSKLNDELTYYQNIYDKALAAYQKYSKYSGEPSWDTELSKTKEILDSSKSKISSIKADIAIYKDFKETKESELEKLN